MRVIEQSGSESCPLCEQQINRPQVLERLRERVESDRTLTAARFTVAERLRILRDPTNNLKGQMSRVFEEWTKTVNIPLPPPCGETLAFLQQLSEYLDSQDVSATLLHEHLLRMSCVIESYAPLLSVLDSLLVSEGAGKRLLNYSTATSMAETLLAEFEEYQSTKASISTVTAQLSLFERLHSHAVEARKTTVQEILNSVAAEANSFYEQIHPEESISTSTLTVRAAVDRSVNIVTRFYGRDEHPLLHYSEAHLDTLGLCYFLAIRRREASKSSQFRVLILDDVLHSVDAQHRGRIATLLRQHFGDHQLLIATHDRHFFERLRATLGTKGFKYLSVMGWDFKRGPILGDASTDLDRILSPEDREMKTPEELSAAGGRMFEWVLRQLTEALEVAVPAKFEVKHTIGDLWPPLSKKLRKRSSFIAAYPDLPTGLDENLWVRNACGAHSAETDSAVTPQEVRAFAAQLAGLYAATHCENCGQFISKQDNDDWRCQCSEGGLLYKA